MWIGEKVAVREKVNSHRQARNSLATTRYRSQSYPAHCIDTAIPVHLTLTLQQSLAGEPLNSRSPDIMQPTQVVAAESSTPATVRRYFQNVTKAMTRRRYVYYPPSIVIPIQWYHKQVVIELLIITHSTIDPVGHQSFLARISP